jgi:peptidoglycan/xylan/chitin deacetylase (PgdA/CDA1 family)
MSDRRILTFHGIGTPERELEPGEAPFWITFEHFTAILDRVAAHAERDKLEITFDDGNASDIEIAKPELLRRGLSATFFVLAGRIGQRGSLTRGDIVTLAAAGMRIGSHGIAHRDWTALTTAELQFELARSKRALEDICQRPIDTAAIPFGRYNAAVLRGLRAAGYQVACSSDRGRARPDAFLRPRTSVRSDTAEGALNQILAGRLTSFRSLRRHAAMALKRFS